MKAKNIESPLVQGYRQILGVTSGAGEEEIKKSYRSLAQRYHPDKTGEDPLLQEQFLKIQEAYDVLTDPVRIEKANREFIQEKLFGFCIDGINITFGSFFGYRQFRQKRVEKAKRLGEEKAGETDDDPGFYDFSRFDESRSILDSAAFDSIELVFAGKLSSSDEKRIQGGLHGAQVAQLPWILQNNRGIAAFLDGNFEAALKIYDDLNARVSSNIIFLYRLGVCHLIVGFQNKKWSILRGMRPDPVHIKAAIECFRRGIAVGENRSIGRQKCLTIRKTLADLYEKTGQGRKARKVWAEILKEQPRSREAMFHLGLTPPKPLIKAGTKIDLK